MSERIITAEERNEDKEFEWSLRPKRLAEFIGQEGVKANLEILISAARGRNEPIEHILIAGPPGLGKTTLANIMANEMGVNIRTTSGPAIEHQGALASILTNLEDRDIFFVDEIQRLRALAQGLHRRPRRAHHRQPRSRYAAGRQPPAAPGARLRPGAGSGKHRRKNRAGRAGDARGRRAGARRDRPSDPSDHRREVRGGTGRARHHRRVGLRGSRDRRGCLRAVPDAARLSGPDASGAGRVQAGLRPPRPGQGEQRRATSTLLRTSDFDYELPPELIAQHPPERRDAARMLVLDQRSGEILHSTIAE